MCYAVTNVLIVLHCYRRSFQALDHKVGSRLEGIDITFGDANNDIVMHTQQHRIFSLTCGMQRYQMSLSKNILQIDM